MKRLLLVWIMMLCLLPVGGWAEENADALYPIREGGLWGYMNRAGEVVIEPRNAWNGEFSDGTAIFEYIHGEGLMNESGEWLFLPEYLIEDVGDFCVVYSGHSWIDHGLAGWYDKASGFFQEPAYDEIDDTPTDSRLILVSWWEGEAYGDGTYHTAYVDRTNGEMVIPFDFSRKPYASGTFCDGYACWILESEDGMDRVLIDEQGARVSFPEGVYPDGDVCEGVLRICDNDGLCGLARPDGTVIVWPQYEFVEDASEGRVFFEDQGLLGIMDLEGHVLLKPAFAYDAGFDYFGGGEVHFFENGNVLTMLYDEETDARTYVMLNDALEIVFSMPFQAKEGILMQPSAYVMENGLVWYRTIHARDDGPDEKMFGLIRLTEDGGQFLTDAVFDSISPEEGFYSGFSERCAAVRQNGLWGYINEQAEWVISPQYDSAASFRDGLALVEKDGKLMYIDHSGAVVWEER